MFAVSFDAAAQYDWIAASAFGMFLDLLLFSAIRIFMIWTFPNHALVIALLAFTVGSILFGTFCGDDITSEGGLVYLTCGLNRI